MEPYYLLLLLLLLLLPHNTNCIVQITNNNADEDVPSSKTKDDQSPKNPVRINKHGLLVFNERNFPEYLITHPNSGVFVKFYAPWCTHCKELEKPWIGIARATELYIHTIQDTQQAKPIAVANFNCDTGPLAHAFCKNSGITAFPHLVYYEGTAYNSSYMGTRSFEDLSIWAERQTGLEFDYLKGLVRIKAIGFRYLCLLMQYSMNSANDDGAKPSGKALLTFGIIVSIPIIFIGLIGMGVLYCCFCRTEDEDGFNNIEEDNAMSEDMRGSSSSNTMEDKPSRPVAPATPPVTKEKMNQIMRKRNKNKKNKKR